MEYLVNDAEYWENKKRDFTIAYYFNYIQGLFTECVQRCISEAMRAEYGDDAESVFHQADVAQAAEANRRKQEKGGNGQVSPINKPFDRFDVQACAKVLRFNYPPVHQALKKYFEPDFDPNDYKNNDGRWGKLTDNKNTLQQIISRRNQTSHSVNTPPSTEDLRVLATSERTIIETLFNSAKSDDGVNYYAAINEKVTEIISRLESKAIPLRDLVDPEQLEQISEPKLRKELGEYWVADKDGESAVWSYNVKETKQKIADLLQSGSIKKHADPAVLQSVEQSDVSGSGQPAAQKDDPIPLWALLGVSGDDPAFYNVKDWDEWKIILDNHHIHYDVLKYSGRYGCSIMIDPRDRTRAKEILSKVPRKDTSKSAPAAAPHAAPKQAPAAPAPAAVTQKQMPVNAAPQKAAPRRSGTKVALISIVSTVAVIALVLCVILLATRNNGSNVPATAAVPDAAQATSQSASDGLENGPADRHSDDFTGIDTHQTTQTQAPTDVPPTQAPTDVPATPAPTDVPATPAPTDAPETQAPTGALGIDNNHVSDPAIFEYEDDIRVIMAMSRGVERRLHEIPDSADGSRFKVGDTRTVPSASFYTEFYSYDTTVAVVSGKGILTAVSPGVTYIVAVNVFSGRVVHVMVFEVTVSK